MEQATSKQADWVKTLAHQYRNARAGKRPHVADTLAAQCGGFLLGVEFCGLHVAARELSELWEREAREQ